VILMRAGRVVADGRKQDVLTAAALAELFGLRVELVERDGYYHLW
jgi:iron complex transport system ATP-binding protein